MSDDVTTSPVPVDRLTGICAEMTKVLDEPENEDVKGIVFLHDEKRSGIELHGYEDQMEAVAELFVHMKAIFQSMGKDLIFIGVPESPEGVEDLQ